MTPSSVPSTGATGEEVAEGAWRPLAVAETLAMKKAFLLVFLFCAAASFAQSVAGVTVTSSEAHPMVVQSHPEHAAVRPLAQEQSILQSNAYSIAHGERPLWEVAPPPRPVVPLADSARALRKEHATARKATRIFEN